MERLIFGGAHIRWEIRVIKSIGSASAYTWKASKKMMNFFLSFKKIVKLFLSFKKIMNFFLSNKIMCYSTIFAVFVFEGNF